MSRKGAPSLLSDHNFVSPTDILISTSQVTFNTSQVTAVRYNNFISFCQLNLYLMSSYASIGDLVARIVKSLCKVNGNQHLPNKIYVYISIFDEMHSSFYP